MTTAGEIRTTESAEADCLEDRKWYVFLASSLITFASGLVIILSVRLTMYLIRRFTGCGNKKSQNQIGESHSIPTNNSHIICGYRIAKRVCQGLVSGETVLGKIVLSISCFCSVGSFVIYLIQATQSNSTTVELCIPWKTASLLDFAFNSFFFVFFILRFIAAENKLHMWLELNSLVDYATIPPAAVSLCIRRDWLGLRFMRAFRLINIPDLLQYLRVLRTGNLIRFAQLISIFISVWFSAAGFVQLVEITGDPWLNYENAHALGYWTCIYFIIVTMSTVGYGDITCVTTLGRGFIVIFIMSAIAMFASFIPEIIELYGNRKRRFKSAFKQEIGTSHVVVCGSITYDSVRNFIRDFLHEDRLVSNIKLVFINSKKIDLELEALFKRYFTKLVYIRGSIMNKKDIQRVMLFEAEACLIMADQKYPDLESQDAANIMRLISIKNFKPSARIILQLMRFQNKEFCLNLPTWNRIRDQIICISELKLGFMATACLAPGFSTLVANLIVMLSYDAENKDNWLKFYQKGAGMEIYAEKFSPAFFSRPFPAVAEICFSKLKLLLVAVCDEKNMRTYLNPGPSIKITRGMVGFFICQSQSEANRAANYCPFCNEFLGQNCSCSDEKKYTDAIDLFRKSAFECYRLNKEVSRLDELKSNNIQLTINNSSKDMANIQMHPNHKPPNLIESTGEDIRSNNFSHLPTNSFPPIGDSADKNMALSDVEPPRNMTSSHDSPVRKNTPFSDMPIGMTMSSDNERLRKMTSLSMIDDDGEKFDATGHVHYCKLRDIDSATLSNIENRKHLRELSDHVILCCFSPSESQWQGLRNFVIPLRLSCLSSSELHAIVIVAPKGEAIEREWNSSLGRFPHVYLYYGSALNFEDLQSVRIENCSTCVILSNAEYSLKEQSLEENLIDKDAILCTLNIKTMFNELSKKKKVPTATLR